MRLKIMDDQPLSRILVIELNRRFRDRRRMTGDPVERITLTERVVVLFGIDLVTQLPVSRVVRQAHRVAPLPLSEVPPDELVRAVPREIRLSRSPLRSVCRLK